MRLGDVCTIIAGQSPPGSTYRKEADGLPFFQGKADFGLRHPIARVWCVEPTKKAQTGDILISVRAPVGPTNVADCECCIGRGLAAIRPTGKANRDYILHTLKFFQGNLARMGSGSTFSAITTKHLNDFEIPLPPLAEQKRIATLLDEADTLRRKRRESLAKLDTLLQSVFLEMFGDPVTNPKGWGRARIDSVSTVVTGNTPSREKPEYYGQGTEWIKSDNINTPQHFLTPATEHLSNEGRKVARVVPSGSVLVTCIAGSPECIGNVAIARYEVAFNQQINTIIPHEPADSFFLYTQLVVGKKLVQRASTQSMKGMVNKTAFSAIELIYPDEEARKKFSQFFLKIDRQTSSVRTALSQSETLFAALQSKAFSPSDVALAQPDAEPSTPTLKPTTTPKIPRPTPPLQPCLTLDF